MTSRSGHSQPVWKGTWRRSWQASLSSRPHLSLLCTPDCSNLHTDLLHRPFFCARVPLTPFSQGISPQNLIPKLSDIGEFDFATKWSSAPFILTDPVKAWPIFRSWSFDLLLHKYGTIEFQAEAVTWSLRSYVEYLSDNTDESPLYLFDKSFRQKMSIDQDAYKVPECFGIDLFNVLGRQRPDHAWLIIGPERGGSTFHKDPNATSAWNAVIRGAKYWIMFPPDSPPPGVYVSQDQSEVTSPLSITEWLLGFHAQARNMPGCKEGVCEEGEILHVPAGWWHLVFNLEEGIAVTQNFVPQQHLASVLDFLKNKPEQVSGFSDDIESPFELFVMRMKEDYPDILNEGMLQLGKQKTFSQKRKWMERNGDENEQSEGSLGFSFGFDAESDEDS